MGRFFVSPKYIDGKKAVISGSEAHHIIDVMRLAKGDSLEFFDGSGRIYQGQIADTKQRKVEIAISAVHKRDDIDRPLLTLIQALPKKKKIDLIIEKATEIGVDIIVPVQSARTVVKIARQKEESWLRRWRKIAQEAAKQCGRSTIPEVKPLLSWQEALVFIEKYQLKLLAHLGPSTRRLDQVLTEQKAAKAIAVCIGPEGDFTADEIERGERAGCRAVSLGSNVLRSDTAALAALAIIRYESSR